MLKNAKKCIVTKEKLLFSKTVFKMHRGNTQFTLWEKMYDRNFRWDTFKLVTLLRMRQWWWGESEQWHVLRKSDTSWCLPKLFCSKYIDQRALFWLIAVSCVKLFLLHKQMRCVWKALTVTKVFCNCDRHQVFYNGSQKLSVVNFIDCRF